MREITIAGLVLTAGILVTAADGEAALTIYTDRSQWIAALGGGPYATEDFSDSVLNEGVSYASNETGHINPSGEYYQDVLASTNQNDLMTTWSFSPSMRAFGGNWTLGGPGGSGNHLLVYLEDAQAPVGSISNSYGGEFWGLVSSEAFGSVRLVGGTGSNQQNYRLDDMAYSAVPEPSLLGLGGVVLRRRRKA
jgi:hypothetical protein